MYTPYECFTTFSSLTDQLIYNDKREDKHDVQYTIMLCLVNRLNWKTRMIYK